jgi:hypothetical protein
MLFARQAKQPWKECGPMVISRHAWPSRSRRMPSWPLRTGYVTTSMQAAAQESLAGPSDQPATVPSPLHPSSKPDGFDRSETIQPRTWTLDSVFLQTRAGRETYSRDLPLSNMKGTRPTDKQKFGGSGRFSDLLRSDSHPARRLVHSAVRPGSRTSWCLSPARLAS